MVFKENTGQKIDCEFVKFLRTPFLQNTSRRTASENPSSMIDKTKNLCFSLCGFQLLIRRLLLFFKYFSKVVYQILKPINTDFEFFKQISIPKLSKWFSKSYLQFNFILCFKNIPTTTPVPTFLFSCKNT